MKGIIIGSTVEQNSDKKQYTVDSRAGALFVLKELNGTKTIRRSSSMLEKNFTVIELGKGEEGTEKNPKKPAVTKKRKPRDQVSKKSKTLKVDIEAIEARALSMLTDTEDESEDIVELEFDYDIGVQLRVPFQAIKILPLHGRVDYVLKKLDSDDEWFKLMFYIWQNKDILRRYTRFASIEEIAIDMLSDKDRPKTLDFNKVKKELAKVIDYSKNSGLIDLELMTKVIKALPNGHNTELSYYLYAITLDLFKKDEWGAIALNSKLMADIEKKLSEA